MGKFLLLIVVAVCLTGQAQMPEPQIAGRVTRAHDGTPIAGATVTLIPPFVAGIINFQTTKTDDKGDYRFETVKEGTYTIEASADGFVSQTYHRDDSPEGVFQIIHASMRLTGIDFRLQSEAMIRGVLMTAAGQPVAAGVHVAAVRKERRPNGSDRLFPASETKTDASGRFVLKKLESGSYFVCVNGPHGYNAARDAGVWYRETWYGNVSSEDGAIQILLREGEERSDIRITVERETRYRVTVWPSGPDGKPYPDRYDVALSGRSHSYSQEHDGSYVIPDVPPGHYELRSTGWSESQYVGAGETSFDVSDKDVTVHVHLGGLGEIGGVVKWAGTADVNLTGLMIGIGSNEGAAQGSKVDAEGRFAFARVLPGHYEFRLLKNPTSGVLRAIRCAGSTITSETPLTVGDQQKITDCELIVEPQQPKTEMFLFAIGIWVWAGWYTLDCSKMFFR